MLDQTFGFFPHVTRSYTGCKNIFAILPHFDVSELNIVHVTRAYTTRHGAGPLAFEQPFPEHIVDNTNHSHLFQGSLRYSPLNLDELQTVIEKDMQEALTHKQYDPYFMGAFTCLDQLQDKCQIILGGKLHDISKQDMTDCIQLHASYVSNGPTRNDVSVLDN